MLRGSLVAIVSPMHEDGSLDLDAFGRLIDRQGDKVGVLPPGHGEKQQVVEAPAWIGVAEMLVRRL